MPQVNKVKHENLLECYCNNKNKAQELQVNIIKKLCFKGGPNLENLTYLNNAKNNIVLEIRNCNIH